MRAAEDFAEGTEGSGEKKRSAGGEDRELKKKRRVEEESVPPAPFVPSSAVAALPAPIAVQDPDVLFGRGRPYRHHPGNQRMQLLVDLHRPSYEACTKEQKTDMINDIVRILKDQGGGRFLKYDTVQEVWFEASDKEARLKIGHAFRDHSGKNMVAFQVEPDHLQRATERILQHTGRLTDRQSLRLLRQDLGSEGVDEFISLIRGSPSTSVASSTTSSPRHSSLDHSRKPPPGI